MKNCANVRSKNISRALIIAYTAVLIALAVVCNMFDIPLGVGDKKLSLSYLPSFVAGIFLGPISGLSVGLFGDVIGLLISPQGPWIPLITLSSALIGLIPGLICKIPKLNIFIKIWISIILCLFICTAGFNTLGIYLTYIKGKKTFWVYFTSRIAFQSIVVGINGAIISLLYYPLKKLVFDKTLYNHISDEEDLQLVDSVNNIEEQNYLNESEQITTNENAFDTDFQKDLTTETTQNQNNEI